MYVLQGGYFTFVNWLGHWLSILTPKFKRVEFESTFFSTQIWNNVGWILVICIFHCCTLNSEIVECIVFDHELLNMLSLKGQLVLFQNTTHWILVWMARRYNTVHVYYWDIIPSSLLIQLIKLWFYASATEKEPGHVKEYPTMLCFGVPISAYSINYWFRLNSRPKLHCGNVIDMPYCQWLRAIC